MAMRHAEQNKTKDITDDDSQVAFNENDKTEKIRHVSFSDDIDFEYEETCGYLR